MFHCHVTGGLFDSSYDLLQICSFKKKHVIAERQGSQNSGPSFPFQDEFWCDSWNHTFVCPELPRVRWLMDLDTRDQWLFQTVWRIKSQFLDRFILWKPHLVVLNYDGTPICSIMIFDWANRLTVLWTQFDSCPDAYQNLHLHKAY